ncbi:MAG TPA: hypothetical protein VLJ17_24630 [Xanthobacteraceae bacterium]|nr:hypothetical protein [Xanthobacteraceae bacterium]
MLLVTIRGQRLLVPREHFNTFFELLEKYSKTYQLHEYIPIWDPESKEDKK